MAKKKIDVSIPHETRRVLRVELRNLTTREKNLLKYLCSVNTRLNNDIVSIIEPKFNEVGGMSKKKLSKSIVNAEELKAYRSYLETNSRIAAYKIIDVIGNYNTHISNVWDAVNGWKSWNDVIEPPKMVDTSKLTAFEFDVKDKKTKNVWKVPTNKKMEEILGKENCKLEIKIPKKINPNQMNIIRIVPKQNGLYFEAHFIYTVNTKPIDTVNKNRFLGIDLGVSNLATCVTNYGPCFIIDGKKLVSKIQYYGFKLQKEDERLGKLNLKTSKVSQKLWKKRNNIVTDYINKSARKIINFCIEENIGTIVIGTNIGWKVKAKLNKNIQKKFQTIPYYTLRGKLKELCEYYGIEYVEQEESYTSKASFFDGDEIPKHSKKKTKHNFSGVREKRGLYKTREGHLVNADVNGALNILKKSKLRVDFDRQLMRFCGQPFRICID